MQYKTRQFTINERALSVVSHDGKQCDIRPKTCQLLLVLLKNTGKLVTKKQLLAEVWNTSVVDEQVIFQSIKEIRALFGDHAVIKTLKKSTQMGESVESFEKKISKLFGKKYGLMVNSGSSALILAIKSLNLKKGSEIITPCLNFGTTISSILLNNFCDISRF